MSREVVGLACILSDLSLCLYSFFFGANIVGVGSWFACSAFLTILPELLVWFGTIFWHGLFGAIYHVFVRLMGVADVRIRDLYIITLHLQLFS